MKKSVICFEEMRGMSDPNPYAERTKAVRQGWVDVRLLPNDLNVEANVRSQKKTGVYKDIEEGFTDNPENFHWFNKGLTITAASMHYFKTKEGKDCLELNFREDDIHGVVDGGHTYRAILDNIEVCKDDFPRFVRVEVLSGFSREEIIDLIEARNKTRQVKDLSLADKKGSYEPIKGILRTMGFTDDKVAYEENAEAGIDVLNILSLLYMFNINKFDDPLTHPIEAFNRSSVILKYYTDNFNGTPAKLKEDSQLEEVIKFLPELLRFANHLNSEFASLYNKAGGNYGNFKFAKAPKNGAQFMFDGDAYSKYKVPKALFFPILAAFRKLISKDEHGAFYWVNDPYSALAEKGPLMLKLAIQTCESYEKKLTPTGKDKNMWVALYSTL